MDIKFYDEIEGNPVIAAVKDIDSLNKAIKIDSIRIIFILFGNICSIKNIVDVIKENNKIAMVHVDLINGLSSIAGGLICDKEDIMDALSAGAICVSSTNQNTWNM